MLEQKAGRGGRGGGQQQQRTLSTRIAHFLVYLCTYLLFFLLFILSFSSSSSSSCQQIFGRANACLPKRARCPYLGQACYWLPIKTRISYKIACLCFNAINHSTPAYLSDLLQLYSPSRSLRSSADTCLLKLPLYKCKTRGDRAFSYAGPSVWNSLPLHIRNATTIDTFKSALKTHLVNFQDFD